MTLKELDLVIPELEQLLNNLAKLKLTAQWVTVRVENNDVRLFMSGEITINPQVKN